MNTASLSEVVHPESAVAHNTRLFAQLVEETQKLQSVGAVLYPMPQVVTANNEMCTWATHWTRVYVDTDGRIYVHNFVEPLQANATLLWHSVAQELQVDVDYYADPGLWGTQTVFDILAASELEFRRNALVAMHADQRVALAAECSLLSHADAEPPSFEARVKATYMSEFPRCKIERYDKTYPDRESIGDIWYNAYHRMLQDNYSEKEAATALRQSLTREDIDQPLLVDVDGDGDGDGDGIINGSSSSTTRGQSGRTWRGDPPGNCCLC